MFRIFTTTFVAIALMQVATTASAVLMTGAVIDQDTGKTLAGIYNASIPGYSWQQEVTAGISGKLVAIDILPQTGSFNPPTESTLFFVNLGAPWQNDAHDFQTVITFPAQGAADWFNIDVSSANIFLTNGQKFVWGVTGLSGSEVGSACLFGHHQLDYERGALWHSTNSNSSTGVPDTLLGGGDLSFRTYVVPVPEPGSCLLLLVAGILGLPLVCRRRK